MCNFHPTVREIDDVRLAPRGGRISANREDTGGSAFAGGDTDRPRTWTTPRNGGP